MATAEALNLSDTAVVATRRFGLDAARATAIVLVLIAHGAQFWAPYVRTFGADIGRIAFLTGIDGVELFFSLSGFLIGGLLLDIQRWGASAKALRTFLIRRWMRTLPLYYLTFFAFLIPQLEPSARERVWSYFLLVQNFVTSMPLSNWFGTSWSLTIEEWSYLALPFLAFVVCRRNRQPLLSAALILICAGVTIRILVGIVLDDSSAPNWDLFIRKIVVTRSDAVAYGVLAAVFVDKYRNRSKQWMTWLGVILVILNVVLIYSATSFNVFGWLIVFPLTGIGFALLMPKLAELPTPAPLFAGPVEFIARISYSLYLVHWPFVFWAPSVPASLQLVTFYGGSLIVAALLSYLVEYPLIRLRPSQI